MQRWRQGRAWAVGCVAAGGAAAGWAVAVWGAVSEAESEVVGEVRAEAVCLAAVEGARVAGGWGEGQVAQQGGCLAQQGERLVEVEVVHVVALVKAVGAVRVVGARVVGARTVGAVRAVGAEGAVRAVRAVRVAEEVATAMGGEVGKTEVGDWAVWAVMATEEVGGWVERGCRVAGARQSISLARSYQLLHKTMPCTLNACLLCSACSLQQTPQ
jgi:hypothetical protein